VKHVMCKLVLTIVLDTAVATNKLISAIATRNGWDSIVLWEDALKRKTLCAVGTDIVKTTDCVYAPSVGQEHVATFENAPTDVMEKGFVLTVCASAKKVLLEWIAVKRFARKNVLDTENVPMVVVNALRHTPVMTALPLSVKVTVAGMGTAGTDNASVNKGGSVPTVANRFAIAAAMEPVPILTAFVNATLDGRVFDVQTKRVRWIVTTTVTATRSPVHAFAHLAPAGLLARPSAQVSMGTTKA